MTTASARFLEFFYFDAGGGHRSAALALRNAIAERYPGWRVELVNLQELLDPVDPLLRLTKVRSQNFYNGYMKCGWTYGSAAFLRGIQTGIKLLAPTIETRLERHWQKTRSDLVVSLIPNFNGVMFRSLRRAGAGVPYVTVMTDLADYPPNFWLEKQDQFVICGSDLAMLQARAVGYRPERVFRTSGMILKPHFYHQPKINRRAARKKLGLDPDRPTALIMFGGYGSTIAAGIVERLNEADIGTQSIVLCGHNEKLRRELKDADHCLAVGFTDKVADYMRLADFFIGKPGPGSVSEALHVGLPVIIERNRRTLPQERYNADWVQERGLGVVVKSFRHIAEAIRLLLKDNHLEQLRRNVRRLDNRAVYEIPDIFAHIIETGADEAPGAVPEAAMFGEELARPARRGG